MKKVILFLAACVALVACNNNEPTTPNGTPFKAGQKITLTVNNGSESSQAPSRKITGTDNTQKNQIDFKWEEGDKILVKVGEASAEFTLSKGAGTASAEFEGTMPAGGNTFDVQYPVSTNPNPLTNQTYVANGIASGLMQFEAKNCSIDSKDAISLSATTAILQIGFTSESTQYLVNSISIKAGSTTYTLTVLGQGETTDTSHPFFIVMNPTGDSVDLTVEVNYTKQHPVLGTVTGTKTKTTTQKLTAGKCLVMDNTTQFTYWGQEKQQ